MPTVKTETIRFEGTQFRRVYSVDSVGTFKGTLPPQVHEVLGYGSVTANSLADCERNWAAAIKKYIEAQTTVVKVIIYDIEVTAYIWHDEEDRCVMNKTDLAFCDGTGIMVRAGVYTEQQIASKDGSMRYVYKLQKSSVPCGLVRANHETIYSDGKPLTGRMDWTPGREAFFSKVGHALEQVALVLQTLNENDAAQIADTGKLPLLLSS